MEEISEFAQIEAALIRANISDADWAELLTRRPELGPALEARRAWLAEYDAASPPPRRRLGIGGGAGGGAAAAE